ncbi:MAG: flagellar hook-associated protein FlgK [Bradyrhizobiaceae bacterium]|nr:flagellar hook-associated protein FlgK [Bradyrhizobiaceae bacterium]
MSLAQAISSALSGLHIAQTGVNVLADNISNAETPGYIRKSVLLGTSASTAGSNGAKVLGVRRELDQFVQRQLRAEFAGSAYASNIANYYSRIEQIYGQPGSLNALDQLYNNFTNSVHALTTSPESNAARSQVLNEASVLAQHLNAMSNDIQILRSQAETSLRTEVERINSILQDVESLSIKIASSIENSPEAAALLDARDQLVAELSGMIDVRVVEIGRGQISIFTLSGVSLFDHKASRLRFDGYDSVGPESLWSADADLRKVGSLRLSNPDGYEIDLIADRAIRSGSIAAHLEMRDKTLVQAQAQLDEIAHALATALSDRTVAGTAASDGGQDGFEIDLSALKNGNSVTLSIIDGSSGQQRRITIVRVDDPDALPLANTFTADSNDEVIGVDLAGGYAGVLAALNGAFGSAGIAFDNPSGMVLRVLDDGGPSAGTVQSLSATITTSTFESGDPTLPFFVDSSSAQLYTNFATELGSQKLGFAGRIRVNPALQADSSLLVRYAAGTAGGDPTRPNFIEQQLTTVLHTYSPSTGVGAVNGPFSGSIADFIRQAVSMQGAASENASRLNEGQQIVLGALQSRFAERAGVNIDSEMAHLLILQQAYGANARVLTTVKEMIDMLMKA